MKRKFCENQIFMLYTYKKSVKVKNFKFEIVNISKTLKVSLKAFASKEFLQIHQNVIYYLHIFSSIFLFFTFVIKNTNCYHRCSYYLFPSTNRNLNTIIYSLICSCLTSRSFYVVCLNFITNFFIIKPHFQW